MQGGPDAATILAKTAAAFLKFLDEAALFYKRLVMQLQVRTMIGHSCEQREHVTAACVSCAHEGTTQWLLCAVVRWVGCWMFASSSGHRAVLCRAVLQSAYGDVKVRLELPPGVPIVRSMGADGVDGMQISTVSS